MYVCYCDGSIEGGNPGGWAVGGWVLKDAVSGEVIEKGNVDLGRGEDRTNNMAEYAAVLGVFRYLVGRGETQKAIEIRSDSQLVIKQLHGEYKCANKVLLGFRDEILGLAEEFPEALYEWVPRAENSETDEQSRYLYRANSED